MARDSFVFYRSFYEAIKDLPIEVRDEVYTAIMEYSLNGDVVEVVNPISRSILTLIKPVLDFGNKQYSNGVKGGRPRKNETQQEANNIPNESQTESKSNPNETQIKPNQNPNETQPKPNQNPNKDKDKDVDNNNINNFNQSEIDLSDSASGSPTQPSVSIDYEKLVAYFNEKTKGVFGNVCLPLSDKRKGMIRARIREHGKKSFVEVIDKAMASDFLKGQSGGWKATFDWLIKPTNYEKVLSGNYDNNEGSATDSPRDLIGTNFVDRD